VPQRVLRLCGNNARKERLSLLQLTALAETLTATSQIEYLDLSYNDATPVSKLHDPAAATFGSDGAGVVARLIRSNANLKYVILEGNAIGADGAELLAQSLSSAEGANIQALNLACNPIGEKVSSRYSRTWIGHSLSKNKNDCSSGAQVSIM
jgi:Leucine-rich repeat (LRR) protein